MATLTKPSSPGWRTVTARFIKAKARTESPFSFQSQTQIHAGAKWIFDLTLPPMSASDAANWMSFLYELERDEDDFALVVTNYVPSAVSSPMTVRLVSKPEWSVDEIKKYGISFTVEQKQ